MVPETPFHMTLPSNAPEPTMCPPSQGVLLFSWNVTTPATSPEKRVDTGKFVKRHSPPGVTRTLPGAPTLTMSIVPLMGCHTGA